MPNFNILRNIGLAFFFLKFYLFIAFQYVYNSIKFLIFKLLGKNSKTPICPYKNTHQDVFKTLCKHLSKKSNLLDSKDFQSMNINLKHLTKLMSLSGGLGPKIFILKSRSILSFSFTDYQIVRFLGSSMPISIPILNQS